MKHWINGPSKSSCHVGKQWEIYQHHGAYGHKVCLSHDGPGGILQRECRLPALPSDHPALGMSGNWPKSMFDHGKMMENAGKFRNRCSMICSIILNIYLLSMGKSLNWRGDVPACLITREQVKHWENRPCEPCSWHAADIRGQVTQLFMLQYIY